MVEITAIKQKQQNFNTGKAIIKMKNIIISTNIKKSSYGTVIAII